MATVNAITALLQHVTGKLLQTQEYCCNYAAAPGRWTITSGADMACVELFNAMAIASRDLSRKRE
jgi:hypothetical protein